MSVEAYLVAEMLQRMEQQIPVIRPQAGDIAVALSKDEYPAAREASAELHRTLDAFVAATQMLRDYVIANDRLGPLGEAFGELTLRARALVLDAQLELLHVALSAPALQKRIRAWFVGQFSAIADVITHVRNRVTKVHAIWLPYRADQPQLPGMTDADRAKIYRTMLRVGQRALAELPDEPAFVRFLDCGMAANDLPDVQLACKRIDMVLWLQLDIELGRQGQRRPRRNVAANGARSGHDQVPRVDLGDSATNPQREMRESGAVAPIQRAALSIHTAIKPT
jgi:hypothetical protein